MTGSFASYQVTYTAAGHARQAVVEEEFLAGVLTVLWRAASAGWDTGKQKSGPWLRSCQGPEQHWQYFTFLTHPHKELRSQ